MVTENSKALVGSLAVPGYTGIYTTGEITKYGTVELKELGIYIKTDDILEVLN